MDSIMHNLNGLLIREVEWKVKTAGPSPFNNERTEIFLLGCKKAMSGNPCKGCFNNSTWNSSKAEFSHDPVLVAKHIAECAPNKYVTIGGGEPTDQIDNLMILCRELKKYSFHIIMYTWRSLKDVLTQPYWIAFSLGSPPIDDTFSNKLLWLMQYVDIVIDGEYKEEERMWDDSKEDGFLSSIGSGNQIVWDIPNRVGFAMKDIKGIYLLNSDVLSYNLNSNAHAYTLHQKEVK
jgi:hypothetical protein